MIRKNTSYHSEGFKVFDDFFIGWIQVINATILSADITAVWLNSTDEKLKFHIIKQKLIEFRDLVLGEK